MKIDAVLFDKDGTLMDFDAFWVTVSEKAVADVLAGIGREDVPLPEVLEAFGVHEGVTSINGTLCKGTYEDLGTIVHTFAANYGCALPREEVVRRVLAAYNRYADAGAVCPAAPLLPSMLSELKKRGIKLGVVTTDNPEITGKCLEKLGVAALFDHVYTDDGILPTKPDPACGLDFCCRIGTEPARVWMVGDTLTDIRFAKNAGFTAVGVAKSDENRRILEDEADVVLSDLSGLLTLLP